MYNAVAPPNRTFKFIVESGSQECEVSNMANSMLHARSYLCRTRRDVPAAVYANYPALLQAGFTAAGRAAAITDTDSTLFQSTYFVDYFKIIRTMKYQLNPGETKHLRFRHTRPRLINSELIASANTLAAGGTTFIWVTQIWGGAAGDSTVANACAIGPASAGFITRERYSYRFNYSLVPKFTNLDNFNPILGNAIVENDDVGAAQVYAQVN